MPTTPASASADLPSPRGSRSRSAAVQVLVVLLACLAVYWFKLGDRPFGSSEGHRVIPAWTMLETGDWWRVRMFEQGYLRKPPGMPWAIAGASAVLGQTEFAARSVSALASTLAALAALWFGTRWFRFGPAGSRGIATPGLACGLMQAALPLFWSPGRSAEIEALNNLGTQLALLGMIDLAVNGPAARRWMARLHATGNQTAAGAPVGTGTPPAVISAIAGLGLVIAALAKGPASLPVLAGVVLGAGLAFRSVAAALGGWHLLSILLPGAALWIIGKKVLAENSAADTIRQGADAFLWTAGVGAGGLGLAMVKVLAMAPTALVSALPASPAALFPWGSDAAREAAFARDPGALRAFAAARALAWTWLVAALVMTVAGVSNPRYAMPAALVFPMMWGYLAFFAEGSRAQIAPKRAAIARVLMLRGPLTWPLVLCGAGAIAAIVTTERANPSDPRPAARSIAVAVGSGTVWAGDLVEARPDVLLYAQKDNAGSSGLKPLWKKAAMLRAEVPAAGDFIILRTDGQSDELGRYEQPIRSGRLVPVGEGRVGRYAFTIYRSE